jgi:hypothetical protein
MIKETDKKNKYCKNMYKLWPDTVPSRTLPVSPLLIHPRGLAVRRHILA